MTEQQHPITPPPELVQQWLSEPRYAQLSKDGTFIVEKCHSLSASEVTNLVGKAASWGSDQELEACCGWLAQEFPREAVVIRQLRAARRPKPPSLKEQALEALQSMRIDPVLIEGINVNADLIAKYKIILCALEQLDD